MTRHPIAESMHVAAALGDPIVFMCPRLGRSFDTQRAALETRLAAHKGTVLMLMDGIRGIALAAQLKAMGYTPAPLFPADLDAELLAVSPRSIAIMAEDVLTVFDSFWGQGIASLCLTSQDVEKANKHLAGHLYVESDDGEICILRLHDPRTLDRLTDVFHEDQLAALMGTVVDAFVFEKTTGALGEIARPDAEGVSA